MRDIRVLPEYLLDPNFAVIGAEDPPEGGTGNEGEGGEGEGGDGGEGGEGEGGSEKEKQTPEDTAGLKSALEKERKANADKDRELRRLQKAEEDRANAEKTEVQRAKDDAEKAKSRSERLAAGFLSEKLNNAIRVAANKANFHDPDDAIMAVDRDMISYEQDDEDPAKVTIDKKTIESAVKKLATSKPHLIKTGTDDGGPTGSQFGGGTRGSKKDADEAALREKYPAL